MMIKLENLSHDRVRFATNKPSNVEVLVVDGKLFVHSEPLISSQNKSKEEEFEKLLDKK